MRTFNSTIRIKTGICPECKSGRDVPLIGGLCHNHYWLQRRLKSAEKHPQETISNKIKENSGKPKKPEISQIKEWFEYHMINSPKVCENCGKSLANYKQRDWYNSQAHILPKAIFHSVADELDNHLVLGAYCCHRQFDTNYLNASKMPCFLLAISRFKKFESLILEHHSLLNEFRQYANQKTVIV